MKTLASQDVAIALAAKNGTLKIEKCHSARLNMDYWAICDEFGIIEVQNTEAEALKRASGSVDAYCTREAERLADDVRLVIGLASAHRPMPVMER